MPWILSFYSRSRSRLLTYVCRHATLCVCVRVYKNSSWQLLLRLCLRINILRDSCSLFREIGWTFDWNLEHEYIDSERFLILFYTIRCLFILLSLEIICPDTTTYLTVLFYICYAPKDLCRSLARAHSSFIVLSRLCFLCVSWEYFSVSNACVRVWLSQ